MQKVEKKPPEFFTVDKVQDDGDKKNDTFVLKIGSTKNPNKPPKMIITLKTPKLIEDICKAVESSTQYNVNDLPPVKKPPTAKGKKSKGKGKKGKKGKKGGKGKKGKKGTKGKKKGKK